jgi:hypothetical protein
MSHEMHQRKSGKIFGEMLTVGINGNGIFKTPISMAFLESFLKSIALPPCFFGYSTSDTSTPEILDIAVGIIG